MALNTANTPYKPIRSVGRLRKTVNFTSPGVATLHESRVFEVSNFQARTLHELQVLHRGSLRNLWKDQRLLGFVRI